MWYDILCSGAHMESIMGRIIHNLYDIPTSTKDIRKMIDEEN